MNEEVLREFLVSLGFKVDEVGLKKFGTTVEGVTKSVLQAGAAVAATAVGIVAGVKIISSQMENLYYASQRTGATVGNLMALRYAASQIGLTADQAQGALEGFARTLRLNPGSNNLLASLGVTGNSPTEKFDSFIGKMREQAPYVAVAYAQLFGIDPDTLLMLEQGQEKRLDSELQYRRKLRAFGIDPEQAAKSGVDFNNSIRSVTDTFNDLWVVIESKLTPVLTPLIDQFERWAENHAGEVAQGIADAVQHLATWIQSVNWKKVGDDIVSVYHAIGGLKGILIGLAAIQLAPLVTGILGLAAAVVKLGAAAGGSAVAGLLKVLGPIALMFHSEDLNKGEDERMAARQQAFANVDPNSVDWNGAINRGGGAPDNSQPGANGLSPTIIEVPNESTSDGAAPRGIRNNNPGNLRYGGFTKSAGATGQDDKGFATFSSMQEGIQAAVKLLQSYVARGYDTIRSIISRWAPPSENNTAEYIDSVAKKLGLNADSHLNGGQLSGVAKAIFDHENGGKLGNASALIGSMGNTRLGTGSSASRSVNVTQKTDIHVSGSADPHGTARAVAGEQSRVNGDLVRNFSGAVT